MIHKVLYWYEPSRMEHQIAFLTHDGDFVHPTTSKVVKRGEGKPVPEEFIIKIDGFHSNAIEQLAEQLAKNGVRPRGGYLEGRLESTEKHLEDMRRIVFRDSSEENRDAE